MKFFIGSVYRSPSADAKVFIDEITKILNICKNTLSSHFTFILGDFNIDLNKRSIDQVNLLDAFSNNGLSQIVTNPTRVTDSSATLIDLIFTNVSSMPYTTKVIEERVSDHYGIEVNVRLKSKMKKSREIKFRPLKKLDTEKFGTELLENFAKSDMPYNFDSFHSIFLNVLESHCPQKVSKSSKPYAPWIKEPEIQNEIRCCRVLKRNYKKKPSDSVAKTTFRDSQRKISKLISTHQAQYLQKISKHEETKSLWKAINKLSHCQRATTLITPEAYNHHYTNNAFLLTNRSPTSTEIIYSDIDASKDNHYCFEFYPTDAINVLNEISLLKNDKMDNFGVSTTTIKRLRTILSPFLSDFINYSIASSSYPTALQVSQLRPIPKTTSSSIKASDYRPIAIQPTFSKVFEKVLLRQMGDFLDFHNVISTNQFGFRKGRSTESLLQKLYDKIRSNLHNGCLTIIVSLDLSKAFDTLDHSVLIRKLRKINFSKSAQLLILNYLRNRSVFTTINNVDSSTSSIEAGVPQGSILGPILFNIYINDFICLFGAHSVFQYADDCQILLTFDKDCHFQEIIHEIKVTIETAQKWCEENALCLNKQKTQILPIFNKNSVFAKMPFFTMPSTSSSSSPYSSMSLSPPVLPDFINFTSSCKLLGIYFNYKLTWFDHFHEKNKQFQVLFHKFKHLFARYTRKVDWSIRFSILSKALVPNLTYCISLFHSTNNFDNHIWTLWNKRICSLTFRRFCHTSDITRLPLHSLQTWTKFKLLTLVVKFLKRSSNQLGLSLKTRKHNLRAKLLITENGPPNSVSDAAARLWNRLSHEQQGELMKKRRLFPVDC